MRDFVPFPRLVMHNTKITKFNLKTQVGKNSNSMKINIKIKCTAVITNRFIGRKWK